MDSSTVRSTSYWERPRKWNLKARWGYKETFGGMLGDIMEIQKIPMPNPLPCPGGEMDGLFTKNGGKKGIFNENSRFFEIKIMEML